MNLKIASAAGILIALTAYGTPAFSERTQYLNLCQELVNSARSYEARASFHARQAKNIQSQIEAYARLPRDTSTSAAIDIFFSQYDENRVMEAKYRELYRQATEEAKNCMKKVD